MTGVCSILYASWRAMMCQMTAVCPILYASWCAMMWQMTAVCSVSRTSGCAMMYSRVWQGTNVSQNMPAKYNTRQRRDLVPVVCLAAAGRLQPAELKQSERNRTSLCSLHQAFSPENKGKREKTMQVALCLVLSSECTGSPLLSESVFSSDLLQHSVSTCAQCYIAMIVYKFMDHFYDS